MDPAYPNQPTNQLTDVSFNRPSTAFPQSAPSSQPKTQNEQSANSAAKPKKAWTLILAWIAFIVAALLFLALGPGSFIVAAITSPYSWVVDLGWVPKIHEILTFAAPVILILAGASVFFTYRKFPTKMRTVIILLSSVIIGLPITILSLNGVIPMTKIIYAIIAAIMTMVPIMLLVILKVRDKNKTLSVSQNTANKKATMIVLVIILAVIGVELGFALFQLPAPISDIITAYEQQKQRDQAIESAAESSGSKSSKSLSEMIYAVCDGEYDVVYQSVEDTGLFECKENSEVYSVTDPHEEKGIASASFLGATYDETVAKYFPDTIYIYRNYYNTDIYTDLILLVEASSEDEAVDDHIDAIYKYIKDINSEYYEKVKVSVFYTEKLDTVKSTSDYILLSGAVGFYAWLPHGNGLGNYYFKDDDASALSEIGMNPSLYSSQTRDAIKFHRHASAEIDDGKTITLEQLREILQDSFVESVSG